MNHVSVVSTVKILQRCLRAALQGNDMYHCWNMKSLPLQRLNYGKTPNLAHSARLNDKHFMRVMFKQYMKPFPPLETIWFCRMVFQLQKELSEVSTSSYRPNYTDKKELHVSPCKLPTASWLLFNLLTAFSIHWHCCRKNICDVSAYLFIFVTRWATVNAARILEFGGIAHHVYHKRHICNAVSNFFCCFIWHMKFHH